VQQAAPTTLIGKAKPAKAAVGLGVQAKAKTAFHEILGAKAAAAKETEHKDAQVRAALLKALSKNKTASDKAHLSDLAGVHGPSEGHGKKAAGNPGHALADAANGGQHPHQQADAGTLIAEAVDKKSDQKKKPAKAADHGSAPAAGGLAMAAVLGIKNLPRLDQKHGEQAKASADNVVSIHQAAGRKDHELRVHLVDARKKHAEVQTEDASGAVKAAKIIVADKDAAPTVVISRDAGFSEAPARETRGHSPIPQAPTAAALERLREMAGSELTRAAGIILRDGGGELKLTLKPESLGNVRIRMNLVDNSIEGRIIVDNAAVKHIFEGSLSSLMRALTAEGFQTASLQVSVGGQNPDNGSRQEREPAPRARRVDGIHGGSGLDWNVPAAENLSMGDLLVNLFV
jgi:flagellar hook-length control protein FliK